MVSADEARLHEDQVVVDCHNDLILLAAHHRERGRPKYFSGHWIPELRRGGVDVQVVPIFVDDAYRPEGALRRALLLLEVLRTEVAENGDDVALCTTGAEIDAAVTAGKIAFVPALEGCEHVGTDVELLETFFRLGVRMASFTHFGRTMLADGSAEDAAGSRLTAAGVAAVGLMQRLGMLVDVSHLSKAGVDHVLEITTRPIVASHSNARALCDHHRNLSDEHLRAIAATGGVIGVNFFAWFLDETTPTLARIADHIEYIAEVAGVDHVGLGPDFVAEYFETNYPGEDITENGRDLKAVPEGTHGSSRDLPLVTAVLMGRGWSDDDIGKVLGANFMRVFRSELGVPA
ncbi:MAG TPA: dipeptidase [Actinomycetota bacterium]|nr:dipeptidase [Actinomycetota bacterium]